MPIGDRVASWFLHNFIIPKSQILDKPGFVYMHITGGHSNIWLREVIIPEELFVELERRAVSELGELGKQLLYSAGKKFGYHYMWSCDFPTISQLSRKDFERFIYVLVRYTESTYASNIKYELNLDLNAIELEFDNYVICNKSGHGYFLTSGGPAGIWARLNENPTIEGYQSKCQGSGAKICKLICGPRPVLTSRNIKFLKEDYLHDLAPKSLYHKVNAIRNIPGKSFKNLLNAKYFSYERGVIMRNSLRYFLCVISGIDLLEQEFNKNLQSKKVLADSAFATGNKIAEKESPYSYETFMQDFFSAIGYGKVKIIKKNNKFTIAFDYFPWTEFLTKSEFIILRNLLAGMLTEFSGRQIVLKKYQTNFTQGRFNLFISE